MSGPEPDNFDENPPKFWSTSRVLTLCTGAYLLVLAVWVFFIRDATGCVLFVESWWNNCRSHWWTTLSSELDANELGDFLAGAFAPLAFLWLVGAVIIQAKELREQRAELKLTRKELGLTRESVDAQVEEMRATTSFIGQQTRILVADEERKKRREKIDDLQAMKRAFVELCVEILVLLKWTNNQGSHFEPLQPYISRMDRDAELADIVYQVQNVRGRGAFHFVSEVNNINNLQLLTKRIELVEMHISDLSMEDRVIESIYSHSLAKLKELFVNFRETAR